MFVKGKYLIEKDQTNESKKSNVVGTAHLSRPHYTSGRTRKQQNLLSLKQSIDTGRITGLYSDTRKE